eukprot:gene3835-4791_t
MASIDKLLERVDLDMNQQELFAMCLQGLAEKELKKKKENAYLRRQNEFAWSQVAELKEFLSDYGMVWIGKKESSDGRGPSTVPEDEDVASSKEWNAEASALSRDWSVEAGPARSSWSPQAPTVPALPRTPAPAPPKTAGSPEFVVNMPKMVASIEELNVIAGEGKSQVVTAPGGERRLKVTENLNLFLYKDGFQLRDGPLRPFSVASNVAFIRDIQDGYFPYELKDEFPEGVPFKLVDYTASTFSERMMEGPANPMSGAQFLNKLPNAVIRNGKVIEVRSEIQAMLGAGKSDLALVDTPINSLLGSTSRPPSRGAEMATLRIKREDGGEAYILKMKAEQTVGDVRAMLDKHRLASGLLKDVLCDWVRLPLWYRLLENGACSVYGDNTQTLRDAGLLPNATLFLRTLK